MTCTIFKKNLRIIVNVIEFILKVSKGAKNRNRYNQVTHLTQDTNRKALYQLGTVMSTDKSLKHLKSKDTFLIANVSNYFEKHTDWDSSSYIQQTVQATGVSRRTVFRVRKELALVHKNSLPVW